jgi:micrococcal nuclease
MAIPMFDDYVRKAKVIRILDGDTVEIVIDLGHSTFTKQKIRIRGIDSPETRGEEKRDGLVAQHFVRGLADACGGKVWVKTYKNSKGKDVRSFTRYVGDIISRVEYPRRSINWGEAIVEAGHATKTKA